MAGGASSASAQSGPAVEAAGPQRPALDAAADRLTAAAAGASGLGGLVLSPEGNSIRVAWKGDVPPGLARAAERERAAGIGVQLVPAEHSQDELLAARERIKADGRAAAAAGIVVMAPATDGSALEISHTGDESAVRALPAVRTATVRLALKRTEAVHPATRWRDTSPYSGGAVVQSLQGGYNCSTAFPVRRPDGNVYMLTAAHCISQSLGSEDWVTAGGALPVGFTTINRHNRANDVAWIERANNLLGFRPSVYMGGTDVTGAGVGETSHAILGSELNYNGNYVCTTGGYSGERCSIKIVNNAAQWTFTGPDGAAWFMDGVQAERTDGGNAVGNGDSGGPVVRRSGNFVYVRGVISAYMNTVKCTGYTPIGRLCGRTVFFGDVNQITQDLNFTVVR